MFQKTLTAAASGGGHADGEHTKSSTSHAKSAQDSIESFFATTDLTTVVGFLVDFINPSSNKLILRNSYYPTRFTNHCTMFFNCKTVFREELIVELMHREVGRTLFSFHTSLTPALSSALPFRWPPTPPPSPMPRCAPTPQPPRMSFSKTLLSLYQRPARSCPCLDPVQ